MRVLGLALALGCMAFPAAAQQARPSAWCGNFMIGSGPNAPNYAIPTTVELARVLPRQCVSGDVLYITVMEGSAAQTTAMLCDYSKTITVERMRDGSADLTCVWTGSMRGERPYTP